MLRDGMFIKMVLNEKGKCAQKAEAHCVDKTGA